MYSPITGAKFPDKYGCLDVEFFRGRLPRGNIVIAVASNGMQTCVPWLISRLDYSSSQAKHIDMQIR